MAEHRQPPRLESSRRQTTTTMTRRRRRNRRNSEVHFADVAILSLVVVAMAMAAAAALTSSSSSSTLRSPAIPTRSCPSRPGISTASTRRIICAPCVVPIALRTTNDDLDDDGAGTTTAISVRPPRSVVNAATLRFNNRLSRMAKYRDSTTAPKVEALLLDAVRNYEMYEDDLLSRRAGEDGSDEDDDDDCPSTRSMTMVIPNTVSFTNAITAWARCNRKDSARRAEMLLDRMRILRDTRKWDHVRPNRVTYNSVITAWARSGEKGSSMAAERLLMEMYDEYNDNQKRVEGGDDDDMADDRDLKPDARSWNAVINAVARSRDQDCADRARSLLDEMGRLYDMGDIDLVPDALTFGAVINAYANSGMPGASDSAAQLLLHMESLYQMGYAGARPTTFVYNACMNAFAKDPLTGAGGEGGTSTTATSSLDRAMRAEQLLDSMEIRYDEGGDINVMPDCISYGTVINAYANCNARESGERADSVLRRMVRRCLLGKEGCRPNAVVFTAAIKAHLASIVAALASVDDEGDDCDDDENQETEDDTNDPQPTAMMRQSLAMPKDGKRKTMEAFAMRCEDLLLQLCLLHNQSRKDERQSLKPTSVTFELVITALTHVKDEEGVDRVKRLRDLGMW